MSRRELSDPRRRRTAARSRRRRYFARAALAGVIATAVWGAFFSPVLRVREIKVVGARYTGADVVRDAVEEEAADNLLMVSASGVADIAERLPWVKEATVDRMLPGTVRVKVIEWRPAAIVANGDDLWTVDSRGHVLEEGGAVHRLPILTGFEGTTFEEGTRVQAPEALAALSTLRSLPRKLRSKVEAVFAPSSERVTIALRGGTQVRYGAAEHMGSKNEVLQVILRRLEREGVAVGYIDVRVPTNPAVGPISTPSPTPSASPLP